MSGNPLSSGLAPTHPSGGILREKIGVSNDTALRLARFFRTSPDVWTNLQARFERETLLAEIGPELERIQPVPEAA